MNENLKKDIFTVIEFIFKMIITFIVSFIFYGISIYFEQYNLALIAFAIPYFILSVLMLGPIVMTNPIKNEIVLKCEVDPKDYDRFLQMLEERDSQKGI